jgi:hypothetical protein
MRLRDPAVLWREGWGSVAHRIHFVLILLSQQVAEALQNLGLYQIAILNDVKRPERAGLVE